MKFLMSIISFFPVFSFGQTIGAFKNATAFIYNKDSLGNANPNGTCFIVGRRFKNDSTGMQVFLVTAKHVLENKDGSLVKEFYIRMNTKDSNSRFIYYRIDTTAKNRNIFFHKDKSVDIAVLVFSPTKDDYVFKYIPPSFIPEKIAFNSLNIEEGNEVFFAGLFVQYVGDHKIFPVFRFGHVSLITDEKILWVGQKREMIFLEISSFGGNSGAPVYARIPQPNGSERLILIGVLSGTFRDFADIQVIQTSGTPVAIYNNGISGVTPSYFLNEILFSDELKKIFGE
jgi:Trypsin-like peptidase domain